MKVTRKPHLRKLSVGKKLTCRVCESEIEIEERDLKDFAEPGRLGCPECKTVIGIFQNERRTALLMEGFSSTHPAV